ncbi:MAG: hypothetical protein PHW42_03980, partial [Patescibacteria group bacterium]|nr:hypothetical protein [Patescibacteria group bacterium]
VENIGLFIKSLDSSTVYLLDENNIKRPYINQGVWSSYFGTDYSPISIVNKTEILNYQLGNPVLYKSGTLIKIQSDSKVYKITENNILRWIVSEEVAERLYGKLWNTLIYDIPEIFFYDYVIGENIE